MMKRKLTMAIALLIPVFAASLVVISSTFAEEVPGTGFSLHLESAQIIGSGHSLNLHRVPVVETASGATRHYDVSMDFSVDENGEVVFDSLSSLEVRQPLNFANFIAGTYRGTQGNTYILSGPAHVGGTRTAWSLLCHECRATMSWTTGSPLNHPDIGTRAIASELPGGFSYGVFGQTGTFSSEFYPANNLYRTGVVIGARQVGNSLTVYRFADHQGTATNTPMASVTLLLQPPQE